MVESGAAGLCGHSLSYGYFLTDSFEIGGSPLADPVTGGGWIGFRLNVIDDTVNHYLVTFHGLARNSNRKKTVESSDAYKFAALTGGSGLIGVSFGRPFGSGRRQVFYLGPEIQYEDVNITYNKSATDSQQQSCRGLLAGVFTGASGVLPGFGFGLFYDFGIRYHQYPENLSEGKVSWRPDAYATIGLGIDFDFNLDGFAPGK